MRDKPEWQCSYQLTKVRGAIAFILVFLVACGTQATAQTFTVLYSFPNEGFPWAPVFRDSKNNFYGTTVGSSEIDRGSVFELDGSGQRTVLYYFTSGDDGGVPEAGVVRSMTGDIFGVTTIGGDFNCLPPDGCGTAFKLTKAGQLTVLHTFHGGRDGAFPVGGLALDKAGNLYGTAYVGGNLRVCSPPGCGVLFKLDPIGNQTVLHAFTGGADGAAPSYGNLLLDSTDTLYGTASGGGKNGKGCLGGCGVVFRWNQGHGMTALYRFPGGIRGLDPRPGLIRDSSGAIYGVTRWGGDFTCEPQRGCGTLYKLTANGKVTTLYRFKGTDGREPNPGLVRDANGNLYGTTTYGGATDCNPPKGCGVVFKVDSMGRETILHTFTGETDGARPVAGLIRDATGSLYGTAFGGGDPACQQVGCGVVFKVSP